MSLTLKLKKYGFRLLPCASYFLQGYMGLSVVTVVYILIFQSSLMTDVSKSFLGLDIIFCSFSVAFITFIASVFMITFSSAFAPDDGHALSVFYGLFFLFAILIFNLGYKGYITKMTDVSEVYRGFINALRASSDFGDWNIVQRSLKCCGARDYRDWTIHMNKFFNGTVPDSCCNTDIIADTNGCGQLSPNFWYNRGCSEAYFEYLNQATHFPLFLRCVEYLLVFHLPIFFIVAIWKWFAPVRVTPV